MAAPFPMTLQDKLAADAFGKSYREFLALKPTHVRWSKLAPQSLGHLQEAHDRKWSMEKLADYLHSSPDEAEECLRRFVMSKKVNAKDTPAERIKQAFFEWTARFGDDEKERERWSRELSLLVANQLHAAALSSDDLLSVSLELEGASEDKTAAAPEKKSEEPPKWGPQWKD
jgi:hypothetical protein